MNKSRNFSAGDRVVVTEYDWEEGLNEGEIYTVTYMVNDWVYLKHPEYYDDCSILAHKLTLEEKYKHTKTFHNKLERLID